MTWTVSAVGMLAVDVAWAGGAILGGAGAPTIALASPGTLDVSADDPGAETSAAAGEDDVAATDATRSGATCGEPPSIRVTKKIATMTTTIAANTPQPMSFCLLVLFANLIADPPSMRP